MVDDDEDARLLVRTVMQKQGFEVTEAKDGYQALEILKVDPEYSVVILDLLMPGMNGREVLQKIRSAVDTAALPVLIRTGTGTERDETELLMAGADDFIPKTADPSRLLARVQAVLRRSV